MRLAMAKLPSNRRPTFTSARGESSGPTSNGGSPPRPTTSESTAEVAVYISHMARDLAGLARAAKLGALAYLLEMTQVEASSAAQKPE